MSTRTFSASLAATAAALYLGAPMQALADVVVVVDAKSPVTTLTQNEVSRIFLGKVHTTPAGNSVMLVDVMAPSALRDEFYTKVTNKTPSQVAAIRANLVFSGKLVPPPELPDSANVMKTLAGNPNAIGYIDKADVNKSVKVILEP